MIEKAQEHVKTLTRLHREGVLSDSEYFGAIARLQKDTPIQSQPDEQDEEGQL